MSDNGLLPDDELSIAYVYSVRVPGQSDPFFAEALTSVNDEDPTLIRRLTLVRMQDCGVKEAQIVNTVRIDMTASGDWHPQRDAFMQREYEQFQLAS